MSSLRCRMPAGTETTHSPEQTEALAAVLAGELRPGDVVVVSGEVGTGKTTFVRGACRALGVEGPITSPTFTIGRLYEARRPRPPAGAREAERPPLLVAHLDLFRLRSLAAEEPGLLDDYVNPATIALIEWPAVAAGELERVTWEVALEHAGGSSRLVTIAGARAG